MRFFFVTGVITSLTCNCYLFYRLIYKCDRSFKSRTRKLWCIKKRLLRVDGGSVNFCIFLLIYILMIFMAYSEEKTQQSAGDF
jgi:hypothetical protein